MESKSVLKAFLFTDIVGATALKSRLGDVEGAKAISRHDVLFRACLGRYGGEEQENPGDGFFASFGLPSDALRCALAFQQGLAALDGPEKLTARVGIHMGESVRVTDQSPGSGHDKLLGLAIDTAARVMNVARARQILLTRHAFDSVRQQVLTAEDDAQIEWRAHGPYRFKGLDDPVEIFEAGISDLSPLSPPADTEQAQRVVAPDDEETLGWRPAVGLPVPGREAWTLERELGAGGFGEVWLARHAETRYVRAFKFCFQIDHLRSLKRELKLFALLREALGDRPDIARLYEVSLQEPPYFLEMEYTAGGNLAEWCAGLGGVERVPLEKRFELIAQLGDALAAAHSVGVIHKDVKPANVLIHAERDGRLQARLTDFGIGEVLSNERLRDAGMTVSAFEAVTQTGSRYGTLTGTQLYIAPELLAGQPPTIRTDIYALGVLLFQIVVGDLKRPIAHGWERDVADPVLRDDIAACVAGRPEDRLPSAEALALRLRSLEPRRAALRSERRRRALLRASSFAAVVLFVLSGVAGVGLWQVELARRDAVAAEARARTEAAKARRITQFLQDMLASVDPQKAVGREVTVREVLDATALRIEKELADQPEIEAAVRTTLGTTYMELGEYQEAEGHLRAALQRTESLHDPSTRGDSAAVALGRLRLGGALLAQDRPSEAEALLKPALEVIERVRGPRHRDTVEAYLWMASGFRTAGRFADAEANYRRALELSNALSGEQDELTIRCRSGLALCLNAQSRFDDATALLQEILEQRRAVYGQEHPLTASASNNAALNLFDRGQYAESLLLYEQALEIRRRVLGEHHPHTAQSYSALARVLSLLGKHEQAEQNSRRGLSICLDVLGEDHRQTANSYGNLGVVFKQRGDFAEAEPQFRKCLEIRERLHGFDHAGTAQSANWLADILNSLGRFAESEQLSRKALEVLRRVHGDEHAATLTGLNNLAVALARQGKYDDAEPWFRQVLETRIKMYGDDNLYTAISYNNLAFVLNAARRYAEAEPMYRRAIEIWRKAFGPTHANVGGGLINLGMNLSEQDRHDEAEAALRESVDIFRQQHADEHVLTARALESLGFVLRRAGKFGPAEAQHRQAFEMRRKLLGADHADVATSAHNLALAILKGREDHAAAEPLLRAALDVRRQRFGDSDRRTLATAGALGACLTALGRYEQAEPLLLECHSASTTDLGSDHAAARQAVERLVELYERWKKTEEAEKYRALLSSSSEPPADSGGGR